MRPSETDSRQNGDLKTCRRVCRPSDARGFAVCGKRTAAGWFDPTNRLEWWNACAAWAAHPTLSIGGRLKNIQTASLPYKPYRTCRNSAGKSELAPTFAMVRRI
ncbi:hypothetical protein [Kingella potus]|uniref:hypothetical protein n=1 Tax=Kingella potus TaxID=265175 RepID=UPI001FD3BE05|nr:hypothetical protein [Kingella potus]UOP00391.1 hypothetical protein LVJ84_10965 [Kingella potus]